MKNSLSKTWAVVACIVGPLSTIAAPSAKPLTPKLFESDKEAVAAIEADVSDRLISMHTPGAALVIVKDGKILDLRCYGYRDFGHLLPVTPETPFSIGACTKQFTAMAAELAVDDGTLSLNDNPQKYLPDFKLRNQELNSAATLRDYLSHSSGINEAGVDVPRSKGTPSNVLRVIAGAPVTAKPGELFQYSNLGYCVAGWAVAAAENTTYNKLIEDKIFRPLDMSDSRVKNDSGLAEDAKGYVLDKRAQPSPTKNNITTTYTPAAGIVSSARDMAKWLGVLTTGGTFGGKRLISERGYEEMIAPLVDTSPGSSCGLGWDVANIAGHRLVNQSSAESGYSASVTFLPDQHLGVVVMTNLAQASSVVDWKIPSQILSKLAHVPSLDYSWHRIHNIFGNQN